VVEPISAQAPRLRRARILRQRWADLTFLHWRVDPAAVAPLLPAGTVPDVYDGSSWVGLIPFRMLDAGLGHGPGVPWLGSFAETNVRTYAVDGTGRRGVVFWSLEAERLITVLLARAVFGLPYTWARMQVRHTAGTIEYASRRRWPDPRGAGGSIVVRPGAILPSRYPLADFLTARWGLHTSVLGRTIYVPNEHEPWPLHSATLLHLEDTLVAAAGFPGLVARPPDSVLWSPGVRTTFGLPFGTRNDHVN
jgi:uncharacterized protein YqjF (DUF2071 family)